MREQAFLSCLWPAFTGLDADDRRLFVGGAAELLNELRPTDFEGYRSLIDVLERARALLELVAGALDSRRPFVRVGHELAHPGLRDVALVGASYGVVNQTLGAVSLLGPLRMDYATAIRAVRAAATSSRASPRPYATTSAACRRPARVRASLAPLVTRGRHGSTASDVRWSPPRNADGERSRRPPRRGVS